MELECTDPTTMLGDYQPEQITWSQCHNPRPINISWVDSGFIIIVGCSTFAVETKERLIRLLTAYINDPEQVSEAWISNKALPL